MFIATHQRDQHLKSKAGCKKEPTHTLTSLWGKGASFVGSSSAAAVLPPALLPAPQLHEVPLAAVQPIEVDMLPVAHVAAADEPADEESGGDLAAPPCGGKFGGFDMSGLFPAPFPQHFALLALASQELGEQLLVSAMGMGKSIH